MCRDLQLQHNHGCGEVGLLAPKATTHHEQKAIDKKKKATELFLEVVHFTNSNYIQLHIQAIVI